MLHITALTQESFHPSLSVSISPTLTHFDEDRVAVLLPRLKLSDEAPHAAAVVLLGPFETLTSVHFPAVQGAAH